MRVKLPRTRGRLGHIVYRRGRQPIIRVPEIACWLHFNGVQRNRTELVKILYLIRLLL